ncbi:polyprenyl synthetase family protein [Acuticoccus sp. MNP-M23]|uniref:polyprenyl synthetase family protein n=1 Tax=Acuticoccus sp. MNP-M23 TaxID=3072793 RepID=UPI0028150121|nr:polyprenyl synthetase family protein [Acuticoccus sp. MNP-M23]WMS42148.1 polyprenyl synthetase family protein [Acuticoccus sp. MNP-M23]
MMNVSTRVERALNRHLLGRDEPGKLTAAITHALFPGGARVRPCLAIAVARACGDDRPAVADGLAAAIEFLHCASLVHDDLPCFDDSDTRRGRPSVHAAHGEAMAVLAGDGLIVLAFQALSDVAQEAGPRLPALLSIVAESAGSPAGLVAGQAMESEEGCALSPYHAAKTGALFEAATAGGAVAAGGDEAHWRVIGRRLGAAYQIADDIHDKLGADGMMGKPTGQDARLGRPSSVDEYGVDGAIRTLKHLIEETAAAVPDGMASDEIRQLIRAQTARFVPAKRATAAA